MSQAEVTADNSDQNTSEASTSREEVVAVTDVIIDEDAIQQARSRSEVTLMGDDDAAKAAGRKFFKDAMKSQRSNMEVLLDNTGHPVVLGNAILATLFSSGLGFEAHQRYIQGQLSWDAVGLGAAILGVTIGVDYFISKWLLKTKFPTK